MVRTAGSKLSKCPVARHYALCFNVPGLGYYEPKVKFKVTLDLSLTSHLSHPQIGILFALYTWSTRRSGYTTSAASFADYTYPAGMGTALHTVL